MRKKYGNWAYTVCQFRKNDAYTKIVSSGRMMWEGIPNNVEYNVP